MGTHDLTGCVLYDSCEPCPMCLGATLWARVSRVVFAARHKAAGFDDAAIYSQLWRGCHDDGLDPRVASGPVHALQGPGRPRGPCTILSPHLGASPSCAPYPERLECPPQR
ncbi:MAG TPA: deaminase [Arachnia sp.]|nr:deaminase [Arachnia sp.]